MNILPYAGYWAKRAVSDSQYRHPVSTDKETETRKGSARAKVGGDTDKNRAPYASRPTWESSRAAKDCAAEVISPRPLPQ